VRIMLPAESLKLPSEFLPGLGALSELELGQALPRLLLLASTIASPGLRATDPATLGWLVCEGLLQ